MEIILFKCIFYRMYYYFVLWIHGNNTIKKKSVSAHTKDKELLYAELDTMYRNLNKSKFPVFVMGDFNARIGFRGNPIKQVGKFGDYCEKFQNENGQFLTEFSNMHYLCHTKTFFQKSTRK